MLHLMILHFKRFMQSKYTHVYSEIMILHKQKDRDKMNINLMSLRKHCFSERTLNLFHTHILILNSVA